MKSVSGSDKYRKLGNGFYARRQLQHALDAYGNSLLHAPTSSESYAYAYGNRSAVLHEMGAISECLRDIERAMSCPSCPQALKEKLDRRKEKCESDVTEKKSSSRFAPLSEYGQGVVPELCEGSNSTLPYASRKVMLDFKSDIGRRLVAADDIEAGSVLIVERPYASVLLEHTITSNCHSCHDILPLDFVPCTNCAEIRYCSETCLRTDARAHSLECGEVNRLLQAGLAYLAYKIFAVSSFNDLSEYLSCPHRVLQRAKILEGAYGPNGGKLYDSGFHCVLNLMAHDEEVTSSELKVFEKTAESLCRLATSRNQWPEFVAELIRMSRNVCDKCKTASESEKHNVAVGFTTSLFLRLTETLICNAHAISALVRKCEAPAGDPDSATEKVGELSIASAIYPTASLMNHSCRPNIFSSFVGKIQVVRASRHIRAGEEILNCYGPQFGRMLTPSRRDALKQQYYFDCSCVACTSTEYQEREAYFTALACPKCRDKGDIITSKDQWRGLSTALFKNVDGCEYLCKKCNYRERTERALEKVEKVEQTLDLALRQEPEWTTGTPALVSSNQRRNVLDAFSALTKLLYVHNKALSQWRDKVAMWLIKGGDPKLASLLLDMNLPTIEFIYGSESIELANEIVKFFDVSSVAEVGGRLVPNHESLSTKATRIFAIHYGKDCVQIKELNEIITPCCM